MTPQEKLKEIKKEREFNNDEHFNWLIARVGQLEKALCDIPCTDDQETARTKALETMP